MRYATLAGIFLLLAFAGCAVGPTASPTAEAGPTIKGMVHGGQQPIVGAHVYLFAANTSGYGGPGIAASSSNASISLLNAATTGYADSLGAYVPTGDGGSFSITGDYLCTPGQQVYLYALGGNAGSGTNPAAGLMEILGTCPAAETFAASVPFVIVNEVSTIAAAYSFAGFASDVTHVSSSGTALALKEIANAFATSSNMYNVAGEFALAQTPAGNGTVPQSKIHTLANILASCVNSSGPPSLQCAALFDNASSAGSSGTVPTETATAAINIAHNPGNAVSTLFLLSSGTAPFQPSLITAPSDFTLALQFSGGSLLDLSLANIAVDADGDIWAVNYENSVTKFSNTGVILSPAAGFTGGGLNTPFSIAIDLNGNAWVANGYNGLGLGSVTEFSNDGVVLSGANGISGGGLIEPDGIAVDGHGNVWVSDENNGSVTELSSAGAFLSGPNGYFGGGLHVPYDVAIDGSGNAWVTNYNNTVTEISSSGAFLSGLSGYIGGGIDLAYRVAIDHAGNAWFANYGGNSVTKLSSNGLPLSGSSGFTGGGLSSPYGVAIDGSGSAWICSDAGVLTQISNSGVFLSGTSGYSAGGGGANSVAVDGAGNVWMLQEFMVTEVLGAATPVVTPLSAGVATNSIGSRP